MKPFQHVGGVNLGRSVFDLSYEKKLTCDMGELIPIMCDEVVPGDVLKIGHELVIRFQPLVAPILHEINAYIHLFFVPYRLLWDDWEFFITGGVDGDYDGEEDPVLPRWTPTNYTEGSLWDYLGLPVDVMPTGATPMAFPMYAYNFIYNNYYRDETLIDEVDLDNEEILIRAWEKDYFTSALPWQQRGTAPALPISGTTNAVWPGAAIQDGTLSAAVPNFVTGSAVPNAYINGSQARDNLENFMNTNSVNLADATTFDISDLRLAFQIQRWLERNARAGMRYTEFLRSHFAVAPRDERLDRPEYIGGMKSPVVVSEVLQTSSTDVTSPQGNLAGHGIGVAKNFTGNYRVKEFGLIMGILSVMPRSAYQQGINRQWLRETKYDFYFPEFQNLSEQGIINAELWVTDANATVNTTLFGYQGRYDEMRVKQNQVVAGMRDTFDYWHLGRQFSTLPTLNETFISCVPRKDIFAVQDEDGLIVNVANKIKAVRPLPIINNPGLIDHV
jgi:hypothetical protein